MCVICFFYCMLDIITNKAIAVAMLASIVPFCLLPKSCSKDPSANTREIEAITGPASREEIAMISAIDAN